MTSEQLNRTKAATAALLGLSAALIVVIVVLVAHYSNRLDESRRDAMGVDDEVRRLAVLELASSIRGGVFDSHVDADVGKILLPGVRNRKYVGTPFSTNAFGLPERDFSWEKPKSTIRIVLLGDSYVFGYGAAAEDRMGVHLEGFFRARIDSGSTIECLHFGVSSWNIVAESSFLRRHLSALRPDLVVHITANNDLDDNSGVRGFGGLSRFSPQRRERANGIVAESVPRELWGLTSGVGTPLLHGYDYESRSRFREAADQIRRLAAATEATGGKYLLLCHWAFFTPSARHLTTGLRPEQFAFISPEVAQEREYWNSDSDRHWNRDGHILVAKLIYGLIQERDLLPVSLERWDEASEVVAKVDGLARKNMDQAQSWMDMHLEKKGITKTLDFTAPDAKTAAQVYGGIDGRGQVAPYASVVLLNGGVTLAISGELLGRPELAEGTVQVFLNDIAVGSIPLAGPGPFEYRWDVPKKLVDERFLSVRFMADDYVYTSPENTRCIAFRLTRIGLER